MEEVVTEEKVATPTIEESLNAVNAPKAEATVTPEPEAKLEAEPAPVATEEPAKVVEENPKQVPLSALTSERRKRQEAEALVQQLQSQLGTQTSQTYIDPDTESLIKNQVGRLGQEFENRHVVMSETLARQAHSDYDEKYAAFEKVAATNPALLTQIMNSDAPGEAAYQAGKQILFQQKYGADIDTQLKRIKNEARTELKKEVEEEVFGKLRDRNKQPTSTSHVRAASGDSSAEFRHSSFSEALSSVLKRS